MVQHGVAVVERAALNVLPAEPHPVVPLVQPQSRLQFRSALRKASVSNSRVKKFIFKY